MASQNQKAFYYLIGGIYKEITELSKPATADENAKIETLLLLFLHMDSKHTLQRNLFCIVGLLHN